MRTASWMRKNLWCACAVWAIGLMLGCNSNTFPRDSANPGGGSSADFSVSVAPAAVTVAPGASQTATVTVAAVDGFSGQVSLSVAGVPAGITVSPASFSIAPGVPQQITVSAAAGAAAQSATLTVHGASGGLAHDAQLALTVAAPADFSLSLSPATLSLSAGGTGTVNLSITALGGFSGAAAVTLSGLPAGVTASPATLTLTPGAAQPITLAAAAGAAAGTAAVTVSATSGALTHSASLALTVAAAAPADFSFSAQPGTIAISAGSAQPVAIAAAAPGNFSGFVQVTADALPAGLTLTPAPLALAPGVGQQLLLSAAPGTAPGPVTLNFTATQGGFIHTSAVSVTVAPAAADFALAAAPASLLLDPGQTQVRVSLNGAAAGSVSPVAVTVAGLPQGVTATPSSFTLSSSSASQAVTVTVAAAAAPGAGTIEFQGAGNGLNHAVAVPVTIVGGPQVIAAATPSSLTLEQNGTGAITVALAATEDLAPAGSDTATLEGLPAGVFAEAQSGTVALPGALPQTFTIPLRAVADAPVGTASLGIHTSLGPQVATVALNVAAAPSFSLGVLPASFALAPGLAQQMTVTAAAVNGFSGTVSAQFNHLPPGITASPASLSLTPGVAQTVTLTADSSFTASGLGSLDASSGTAGSAGGFAQSQSLAFTALPPAPSGLVSSGLLAYYPMNEGSGTVLHDAGPNGYTANFGGADNSWVGGGVEMDGNGWIDLPAALNAAQTMQMWVYTIDQDAAGGHGLVGSTGVCCNGITEWQLEPVGPGSGVQHIASYSYGGYAAVSNTPFAGGATLGFTMGSTAAGTKDRLYIDGDEVFYRDSASGASAGSQTSGHYQIGAVVSSFGLHGLVGPAVFYNRALSAAEIAANAAYFNQLQQTRAAETQLTNALTRSQLVGLGDSITLGYNSGPYCNLLSLDDASYDAHCVGVIGQTSSYGLAEATQMANYYATQGPKSTFLVWFGTNDVVNQVPATQIVSNLLATCSAIKQVYPGARVALGTMLSRFSTVSLDGAKNALNDLIRQQAGQSCDGYVDFAADPNLGADGAYAGAYFFDQTHPTATGYQRIGDMVSRYVNSQDGATASHPTAQSAASYAMTAADNYVQAAVSGDAQWTLPECQGLTGKVYQVSNAGAGTLTLTGAAGETVSGANTVAAGATGRFQIGLVGDTTGGCSWSRIP